MKLDTSTEVTVEGNFGLRPGPGREKFQLGVTNSFLDGKEIAVGGLIRDFVDLKWERDKTREFPRWKQPS